MVFWRGRHWGQAGSWVELIQNELFSSIWEEGEGMRIKCFTGSFERRRRRLSSSFLTAG